MYYVGDSGQTEPLAPVLVWYAGPARQRRVTVLFRLLLAIPHLFVLSGLGMAASVVMVIGWFGALFTGRLPRFAADFLTACLCWQTRVYGYLTLLTDEYPPFAFGDAPYPVRVAVRPGRLNRLAVLFRLFLMIPAGIVAELAYLGAFTVMGFVSWLIVLVRGELPAPLYQADAAVLRYYARYTGYATMLTSAYPGGLFGDQTPAPAAPFDPAAADPAAAYGAAPADPWRLTLTRGARRLVGWFLVIGVLVLGGVIAADAVAISGDISKLAALDDTDAAFAPLNSLLASDDSALNGCGSSNVSCLTGIEGPLATAYGAFATQLAAVSMPSGQPSTGQAIVVADARQLSSDFRQLSHATSAGQYASLVSSGHVKADSDKFSSDYDNLLTALGATLAGGS